MRKEEQPIVERLTYHKQLFRHDPESGQWGDCARTCIACLLGLAPEDVPHEHRDMSAAEHNALYDAFLHERGITRVWIGLKAETVAGAVDWASQWSNGLPFILSGESPRGTNHVVLGHAGKIIHDPHPDGGDIVGPMDNGLFYVEWLVSPASTIEALQAEIERLKGERDRWEKHATTGDGVLERTRAKLTIAEFEASALRKALEQSVELIDHLMHVHVAPDECSSFVSTSRKWFAENGGTLACIAEQQKRARTLTEGGKDG